MLSQFISIVCKVGSLGSINAAYYLPVFHYKTELFYLIRFLINVLLAYRNFKGFNLFRRDSMTSLTSLLDTHNCYLLGHRGARGEQLENSKAGFIHTQQLSQISANNWQKKKLVGIEFDVQLTLDGQLVVFHDDTLLRLFSHQSRIDQLTAAQIQRISRSASANQSDPMLLLQQMPEFIKNYSHIELEIKTSNRTNYQQLIQSLKQCLVTPEFKTLPLTLTSFDVHLLEKLQADIVLSQFKRGLLVEPACPQLTLKLMAQPVFKYAEHLIPSTHPILINDIKNAVMSTGQPFTNTVLIALRLGCSSIGLFYPLFDSSFMAQCQRYDLATTAWTVNNIDSAKHLIKLGVNYLITDYPSTFLYD